MPATVQIPVSDRQVRDDKAVVPFLNKEVIPALQALRKAANAKYEAGFALSTAATGAWTNIWTSASMPTGSAWYVTAEINMRVTSGAVQRGAWILRGVFYNDAGTVAQQGATSAEYTEASAGTVRMQVSGQTVTVDVRDDGVSTMAWVAFVSALTSRET